MMLLESFGDLTPKPTLPSHVVLGRLYDSDEGTVKMKNIRLLGLVAFTESIKM